MEDITDGDYMHTKTISKDFDIENLGKYQDLYLKSDTLLSADVFENFKKISLKILSFRSCKIYFSPCINMPTSFKED